MGSWMDQLRLGDLGQSVNLSRSLHFNMFAEHIENTRVWVNTYRYIFSGMNIHKSQLFWGSLGTRVLTHPHHH